MPPMPLEPTAVAWSCVAAARRRKRPRLPFSIGAQVVGSVALDELGLLDGAGHGLRVVDAGVQLPDAAGATAALAELNALLRKRGRLEGWRDEQIAIVDPAADPAPVIALTERAAARFWGTLTLGAHANGWLAGADGRPSHLWIARRSPHKPTDPGMLDNLVGGGVPHGQTPFEALVREGWEEAGLAAPQMHTARAGRVIVLHRDLPEGLQHERLHAYDLELPRGVTPVNQDGEVAGFECLPVRQALAQARDGEMTVDAALATLDFALRHGLLPADEAAGVDAAAAGLWHGGADRGPFKTTEA